MDNDVKPNGADLALLLESLESDDWNARAEAAIALGEIGDKQTVPALVEALQQGLLDESQLLANCTVAALGKIGDPRAVDALLDALHPSHLIEKVNLALESYTPDVSSYLFTGRLFWDVSDIRCAAAQALREIGDTRTVTGLIQALNDPHDRHLHKAAAQALERIGTSEAITAVKNWQDGKE